MFAWKVAHTFRGIWKALWYMLWHGNTLQLRVSMQKDVQKYAHKMVFHTPSVYFRCCSTGSGEAKISSSERRFRTLRLRRLVAALHLKNIRCDVALWNRMQRRFGCVSSWHRGRVWLLTRQAQPRPRIDGRGQTSTWHLNQKKKQKGQGILISGKVQPILPRFTLADFYPWFSMVMQ